MVDSSDYEEPTPSCTSTERHTSTGRPPFPHYHQQQQRQSSMVGSKCTVTAASFPASAIGPSCRQSLLLVDNNFPRMPPNKMPFSPSNTAHLHHPPHHHYHQHCPPGPGDSPSLLLCSSGSASAYATSSLLRCSSSTNHYPPPPQPPNFPPPRRRQRTPQQQQRRRGNKGAEMGGRRKCMRLRFWLALAFLLLAALLILPLLIWLTVLNSSNPSTLPSDGPIDDYRISSFPITSPQSSSSQSASPIPSPLPLNRQIHFNLPGHHLLFSQIAIPVDSLLQLNFTLPPNSRLVLFARQTLRPSPGQFDWQRILVGEKLHLVRGESRLALVSHFAQAGKWHFAFLNDRSETESIGLIAGLEQNGEEEATAEICKFDCFGKGECREGKCVCHPGFGGPFCEETVCPVLCSGQGVFSGGQCHCHEGFKGAECELSSGYCADSDCGGHGQCQSTDGICACEAGWTGENCGQRECPGKGCSKAHGICLEGKCFCEPGWMGEDCGTKVIERREQIEAMGNEGERRECPANCSARGECTTEGECQCQWGWTGPDCSQPDCPFGCERHGKCVEDGRCQCFPGWSGENCQIEFCTKNCSRAGQCLLQADGWHCECQKGKFGENCEFGWESSCEDGVDNDGDGLTDCEDSTECCAHSSCSSDPLCLGPLLSRELLLHHPPIGFSTFADRFRFLFDGGHLSVQRYADIRLLDKNRLSILRGRILSEKGGPLIGVRVSDAQNAQQGFSLSRAGSDSAGEFELAVNGGGTVNLQFVRQPYGRLVRSFFVPSNQLLDVGPIWMDRPAEFAHPPFHAGCLHSLDQLQFRPIFFLPSSSPLPPPSPSDLPFPLARLALDSRVISLAIPIRRGHFLVYSSARANSSQSHFRIQLLGEKVPSRLLLVHLELEIAGKRFGHQMAPKANLEFQFGWNRENAYWQREAGMVPAKVSIGFQFADCPHPIWQHFPLHLPSPPISPSPILPSALWSLSSVHRFHPELALLERGDGQYEFLTEKNHSNRILRNLEAFGLRKGSSPSEPLALAPGPDGSIYLGQSEGIERIWPNVRKEAEEILKLEPMDSAHPYFLAIHPSTAVLHISLPLRRQIWRIVEGEGPLVVSDAQRGLTFPKGIGFDLKGNLLVLDGRRLVQLDGRGTVERVLVGNGPWRPLRDCARRAPLKDLILEWPTALSVDPISGQLFLLDSASTIFRLDLRLGIASLIVGVQRGCGGASEAEAPIESIAFCPVRRILYMAMSDGKRFNAVKSLESAANHPPGPLQTIVGQSKANCDCDVQTCACDDPEEMVEGHKAHLNGPKALAPLPNGDLLIADQGNGKLKRLEMPRPEFDEGRGIFVVNSPEMDEQFEFDRRGRHLRTRSLLTGIVLREMEYGEGDRGEMELEGVREGGEEKLMRIVRNGGGEEGEWRVEEGEGGKKQLAKVEKVEMEGANGQLVVNKITTPSLPHPILLDFGPNGQLLQSISIGPKTTSFGYDPATGLANSAKFPGEDGEWTMERPAISGEGRWRSRIIRRRRGANSADSIQTMELEEAADGELALSRGGAQTLFRLSRSPWPHFGRQLSLSAPLSLQWHFDFSAHPQMRPWERALARQRLSLQKGPNSIGGTSRGEWRVQLRRPGGKSVQVELRRWMVGRRRRLNGRNQFSVDFDQSKMTDSIVDPFDNKLLEVKYSKEGKLRGIEWPNGLKMESESGEGGKGKMRRFKWDEGRMEWAERRNGDGRKVEQFLMENGRKAFWRRLEMGEDGKEWKVILPDNSTFIWSIDSANGTIQLISPSGERHSLAPSLPLFHPKFSQLAIHSVKSSSNSKGNGPPKLQWIEARNGGEEWNLRKTGKNWVEIERDEWGQMVGWKQANDSLAMKFELDEAGRAISVHSPLFTRQTVFSGPLPISSTFSPHFGGISPISAFFNWSGADQMFLPSAFGLQLEGEMVDWRRVEFAKMGQKRSREGQFRFENEGPEGRMSKIIGDLFRAEFQLDQLGRPIQKRYFFPANAPEPAFITSFAYGQNGEWKSENWTNGEGKGWNGTREMDENGKVIFQRSGSRGDEWRIGHGADGRPNQMNGIRLRMGEGGVPIRFGEIAYETEGGSGWTRRRGMSAFQFDGLGQPISFVEGQKHIEYVFEEKGRLIGRRSSEEEGGWLQMHFGDPMRPNLCTHFWHSSDPTSFWRIFWTENGAEPFFLQNAKGDQNFVLLTDADKSIRLWLDMRGQIVRENWHSPTGEWHGIPGANPPPKFFPLGFRSQFHDFDARLLIFGPSNVEEFPASRPFDPLIGRFMSHHNSGAKLDLLRPEPIFDPFGWHSQGQSISREFSLANFLSKLMPSPSFANWMKSPFGLPKMPSEFGLTEMERLKQQIGIFQGRITSLDASEGGDWMGAEFWGPILGGECKGIGLGIWTVERRNGTKISFKMTPHTLEGKRRQNALEELLNGVEMVGEEDLDKILGGMGEEREGRPALKLAKKMERFEGDKAIVEELAKGEVELGERILVDLEGKSIRIGPGCRAFHLPILIGYIL